MQLIDKSDAGGPFANSCKPGGLLDPLFGGW
jgi:hypothetical protein